jgi:hypothetical protein
MEYIVEIILIIAIIITYCYCKSPKTINEQFGEGALMQLYNKGPQDVHLTTETDKYVPEYVQGYYPWNYYMWNQPSRINFAPVNRLTHKNYSSPVYSPLVTPVQQLSEAY